MAVFCGSRSGDNPLYAEHAARLGRHLAAAHITLVFGAGNVGLMGEVARAALHGGGRVVGVLPKALRHVEKPLSNMMEFYLTETMHERKKLMYDRSDAICILPGGLGSLDEMFEVLTWRMIGILDKPVILVDMDGYWAPLLTMIRTMIDEGFAPADIADLFTRVESVDDVVPTAQKLLSRKPQAPSADYALPRTSTG